MEEKQTDAVPKYSTPRRETYASWLENCSRIGLAIVAISFAIYVTGSIESHLPVEDIPSYWGMSAAEYMQATGYRGGWSWTSLLHKADYMNFIGICLLASVTMICNLRLIPMLLKENDRILAGICIAQIIVILLAASGILAVGH